MHNVASDQWILYTKVFCSRPNGNKAQWMTDTTTLTYLEVLSYFLQSITSYSLKPFDVVKKRHMFTLSCMKWVLM